MGDVVLPAGTKMQMLGDALGTCSHLDFAVLFWLYHEVDRRTGITEISHDEIAEKIGCKKRAAQNSTRRLIDLRQIVVERKRLEGSKRDGSPVYGGEGGKNRYRLLFERTSGETLTETERTSAGTLTRERTVVRERTHGGASRERPAVRDTLYPESSQLESLARARDRKSPNTSIWQTVKGRLTEQLGTDVVAAWFDKLTIAEIAEHEAVLIAPSKFLQDYILQRYQDDLTEAWCAIMPMVTSVRVIERKQWSSRSAEPPRRRASEDERDKSSKAGARSA